MWNILPQTVGWGKVFQDRVASTFVTDVEPRMNPQVARSRAAALAAAREILFSQGWDAVTHASVSKRSGVGRTTLYRHWPTIEQLLRDVLLSESEVRHPAVTGVTRADLTAELDALRAQLSTPALERAMSTIMDRATVSPEFARVREGLHKACSATLSGILRTARDRGELRADTDLEQAVAELVGALIFQHFLAGKPPTQRFAERVVDAFLRAHQPAEHYEAGRPRDRAPGSAGDNQPLGKGS
jgi:AcrR family transcriptional regulator